MFDIREIQEHVIYEAVKRQSDAETASEIVFGNTGAAKGESNSAWVKSTMCRLEEKFDAVTVKQIRMNCQCGYGMDEKLALLNELKSAAANMEEFAGAEKARAAGLFCEDGQLYLKFLFCPCPILAQTERLDSMTWCQCSAGYSKVLFEKAFGCEVDVTLLNSIKCGDDVCLMRIVPQGRVWE